MRLTSSVRQINFSIGGHDRFRSWSHKHHACNENTNGMGAWEINFSVSPAIELFINHQSNYTLMHKL
jgi:hypothetical protein